MRTTYRGIAYRSLLLLLAAHCVIYVGGAAASDDERCFSLDRQRTFLGPLAEIGRTQSGQGRSGGQREAPGVHWAAASQISDDGIEAIVERLRTPYGLKDRKTQTVVVTTPKDRPKGVDHFEFRKISMRPVFFLYIEWDEDWFFDRISPTKFLVSLQKTTGTHYIRHFCGSILLEAVSPTQTRIYRYEELSAERQAVQDTIRSVEGEFMKVPEQSPNAQLETPHLATPPDAQSNERPASGR